MSTLNDLIASIHSSLHSYTGLQEQATWLTADVNSSVTTMTVQNSDFVLRGVAEIDDELIYVDSSDAGMVSLAPFGRGYRGSTAASHVTNTQVTFDPVFPRCEIRRAIDQTIETLFPMLYQIKTADLAFSGVKVGFSLPADCEGVIEAKWHNDADPLDYWIPVSRWSYDPTSPLANGKALNIVEDVPPGSTVRVNYRAKFGTFVAGTDTLASVGLPESYADLILYAVSARMVRFLDPARLQISTVENLSRAGVVQSGDASKIANQLYSMFQQRMVEERSRLLELNPPSIHFTR